MMTCVIMLKRENIELDEGTVAGIIECHEKRKVSISKNEQTHMVMQNVNYMMFKLSVRYICWLTLKEVPLVWTVLRNFNDEIYFIESQ